MYTLETGGRQSPATCQGSALTLQGFWETRASSALSQGLVLFLRTAGFAFNMKLCVVSGLFAELCRHTTAQLCLLVERSLPDRTAKLCLVVERSSA